ncbi:hypothetical protein CFP56_015648 [Quercus suber]|uniref:Uncharacterized protein n=1 Tax=Quercus suber TaxID=58331 RepID=A0AAW0KPT0_QUESU
MIHLDFRTWSTIIRSCWVEAMHNKALSLFFQSVNQASDLITKSWRLFLNPVLPALSAIKLGKALHGHIVKRVIFITTTYLKLYLTCGEAKPNPITIVTTLPACACLLNK